MILTNIFFLFPAVFGNFEEFFKANPIVESKENVDFDDVIQFPIDKLNFYGPEMKEYIAPFETSQLRQILETKASNIILFKNFPNYFSFPGLLSSYDAMEYCLRLKGKMVSPQDVFNLNELENLGILLHEKYLKNSTNSKYHFWANHMESKDLPMKTSNDDSKKMPSSPVLRLKVDGNVPETMRNVIFESTANLNASTRFYVVCIPFTDDLSIIANNSNIVLGKNLTIKDAATFCPSRGLRNLPFIDLTYAKIFSLFIQSKVRALRFCW